MRCRAARAGGNGPGDDRRRELAHVGLDGVVTGVDLSLTRVIQFEILLEHKQKFRAIVAGQRRRDLGRRGTTAPIAMHRQDGRIMRARHDCADDAQPSLARDGADHRRQLQIHLHERLLHPLDVHRRELHQRMTMPQIGAQRDDRRRRPKAAAHEPDAVQIA